MTESSSIRLNEHQRRHFAVLFARLEESLNRVENMLTVESPKLQRLSVIQDDVPDGFREHALPVLAGLRARIEQLANRLDPLLAEMSGALSALAGALNHPGRFASGA